MPPKPGCPRVCPPWANRSYATAVTAVFMGVYVVWSSKISLKSVEFSFSFSGYCMHHFHSYILQKNSLKLVYWLHCVGTVLRYKVIIYACITRATFVFNVLFQWAFKLVLKLEVCQRRDKIILTCWLEKKKKMPTMALLKHISGVLGYTGIYLHAYQQAASIQK